MSNISLNNLRDRAYQCACAHGFHDEELSDEHFLMLVITELAEAVEADRAGSRAKVTMFNEWQGSSLSITEETRIRRFKEDFEAFLKNTVEDELSDAVIRLLDLAGLRNIDVNDRFIISYVVTQKKTFPENCYAIIKDIVNYKYSLEENINYSIRQILKLASFYNIDLFWHIEQKMKYNELRGYKHGKLY